MADASAPIVTDPNPGEGEPEDLNIGDAPVTKEEPKAEPVVEEGEGVVEYEPTGDVGLDMALAFVGKAGIGGEHPAMQAALEGNFDMLRAVLGAKGIQGWEQYVALGEKSYANTQKANGEKAKAAQKAIHEAAGGPEQWAAIREWAAANATPEEKAAVNAQLNAGGVTAKMAAVYLAGLYAKAGNVNEDGAPVVRDGATRGTPSTNTGALDGKAYAREVAALHQKLGGNMEESKEYAALQRRRAAFRG